MLCPIMLCPIIRIMLCPIMLCPARPTAAGSPRMIARHRFAGGYYTNYMEVGGPDTGLLTGFGQTISNVPGMLVTAGGAWSELRLLPLLSWREREEEREGSRWREV